MRFRRQKAEPVAQVVIRAETHEQLDHILLALNQAIRSYGAPVAPDPATTTEHSEQRMRG
jgi:hypothetical protein